MQPSHWGIWNPLQVIGWKHWRVILQISIVFASTINGASYLDGRMQVHMMFNSLITISKFWRWKNDSSNRIATHPGVILLKEFLEPLGLTQKALATHIGIPIQRVNEVVRGKRGVSPDTAWLLSEAFNTSPEFWLNLQATHDLSLHKPKNHVQPLVAASA